MAFDYDSLVLKQLHVSLWNDEFFNFTPWTISAINVMDPCILFTLVFYFNVSILMTSNLPIDFSSLGAY